MVNTHQHAALRGSADNNPLVPLVWLSFTSPSPEARQVRGQPSLPSSLPSARISWKPDQHLSGGSGAEAHPSDVRKPSHTKMNLVIVAEAGTADAGSGANCGAEDFPPLSFWFLICKVGAVRVPPLEGPSEDRMTQRALHVAWIATWIITLITILSRSLLLSINFRSAPTTPPCAG